MPGIGFLELLVIGVVALIVIGPKELPVVMQRIGKFAGTIRRMGTDFQRELNKSTGLDEVRSLRSSIVAPLKATTDAIRKEFNTVTPTGQVQPSGAIKPADPKAESIVDELHAAAGMKPVQTPAEAMKDAIGKATATPKAPVKAAQVTPAMASSEVPEAARANPKKRVAKKPVESPAPIEAIAPAAETPAKKASPKKPAAKRVPKAAVAEAAPAEKPKRKPAAKKA